MWSVVALLGVVCSGACDPAAQTHEQRVRLIASTRAYERDIPLPVGFSIVEQSMEDHSTGQCRTYLRHLYAGSDDKFAVRNFYREQMPLMRWAKMSDGAIKGDFSMRFAKGNEVCEISINEEGRLFGNRTLVQIRVAQEQRGTTPPLVQNRP